MKHAGWRSRGYLPHCDNAGLIQHIVFGLADAPAFDASWIDRPPVAARAQNDLPFLKDACADVVQDALLHFDGQRYFLIAWCVMPTHVHAVVEQLPGERLDRVIHSLKSFTANAVNRAARRNGRLWRREYFDRFMRDGDHLNGTIQYVENNPVAAGLALRAEDWAWSSAGWKPAVQQG